MQLFLKKEKEQTQKDVSRSDKVIQNREMGRNGWVISDGGVPVSDPRRKGAGGVGSSRVNIMF